MSLSPGGRKFRTSNGLKVACCIMFVLIVSAFAPGASANTGTVHLSSAYDYRSVAYDTYVKWTSDLYGDSVQYGLGSDSHINFTDFSMGSPNNPSWTFGVVSQNGNVTITAIETSYIRFSAAVDPSSTLDMTFYFTSLPVDVYVAQPTNVTIPSTSYYSSYGAWADAPSPSVYVDPGLNYLMVKTTYATPTIQLEQNGTTTTSSSSNSSAAASRSSASSDESTTSTDGSGSLSTSTTSTSAAQSPGFDLALSSSSGSTNPGESVTFQVTVTSDSSSTAPVALSSAPLADGLKVSFGGAAPALDYTDSVTVSVPQDILPGVYSVTVYGSTGRVQESASYALLVLQKDYSVQVGVFPAGGGTLSMLSGDYSIAADSNITLSEQPSPGWSLSHWLVDGAFAGNATTLNLEVDLNATVTAVFSPSSTATQDQQDWYPVTIGTSGAPYSTVVVDGVQYETPITFEWPGGSSHNITAVQAAPLSNSSEEVFQSWSSGLGASSSSVAFTTKGPVNLTANYVTRYAVDIVFNDESGQSITPYSASLYGPAGQVVVPSSGFLWLQKGSYYVTSASWEGQELIQPGSYPEMTVTGAASLTVALPVYELTVTVQDIFGDPLSGATVTLSLPNGTMVSGVTGPTGRVYFQEVPAGEEKLASDYLGVSSSFTVNPAQGDSPTLTIALSYPVFALVGLVAATMAIVTLKVRHKGPFR